MGMREGELKPDQRVGGSEFQADQAALFWIAIFRNWTSLPKAVFRRART
jgi:hypothetical protein